jgi:hypothetical protein
MMRKLFVLILIAVTFQAYGQREVSEDSKFKDRLYLGGNFGLSFGNWSFVNISPVVGYMITNRLSAGPGITYQYMKTPFFKTSVYGGRGFVRYNITQQFFGLAEYENLNIEYITQQFELRRTWVPGTFLGGGFFQPIGRRSGFALTVLYNFSYNERLSPYPQPYIIRAGFTL